ncbi:bacteriocin-like protein [Chryseobacterium sp. SIMBA_029]|uniref:bacteriocin-like protein n=1 Tax=Chryseobacterium sp. SIMBA_029 TaxID=3085772 RepID=UPI00397DC784
MKNLQKVTRESLKTIKGGLRQCPIDGDCGPGYCCSKGACRPFSGASPTTYLCDAPLN